jgi:hypothetical protein
MASMIWADRPSGFHRGCPPEPAGRSPRGRRRWIASIAAALLLGVAGFAQGARTAIGADGVRALANEEILSVPATRTHVRNDLGGSFGAPRGSTAQPPEVHLQGRRWTPAVERAAAEPRGGFR